MPFTIIQAGSALKRMSTAGDLTTITLPSGVTIDATVRGRFAVIGRRIVFIRAPSKNLVLEADSDVAHPLAITPPTFAPTVAAGSGTGLTGTYKVRVVFKIKDEYGFVQAMSAPSPESSGVALSNQTLAVSNIAVSSDPAVNARGLERTTNAGSVYYPWFDIDDNTSTSAEDAIADAALSLLPSPDPVIVPAGTALGGSKLRLIMEWKGFLWAVSDSIDETDYVLRSDGDNIYSWPGKLRADPVGADEFGVTALMPRRDELGIGKRDLIHKIRGSDEDTFEMIEVVRGTGPVSQESVVVVRDVAYFLGEDGVYSWDAAGVTPLSDDRARAWFTTDTYFNRTLFDQSEAKWNPVLDTYELHLAAVGTSDLNRWVALHLSGPNKGKWLGPHKTGAFTPTAVGLLEDANDLARPVIAGSDGHVYEMNSATKTDGASTAIDLDVMTGWHSANTPDILKFFKHLLMRLKKQSGGTLEITPYVGEFDAAAQLPISHDMTVPRRRHRRLGIGRFFKLRLRNNVAAEDVTVSGYEVPYHEVSRR